MPSPEITAVVGQALDDLSDFVGVLDAELIIRYVNSSGHRLLGYADGQLHGCAVVDVVHPDDLERAFIAVAHVANTSSIHPVTPAYYRLRCADGSWLRVELNATLVGDEVPDHIVIVGRTSGDNDLQDRLLELLSNQGPFEEAIALVPEFGEWRHEGVDYAVLVLDEDGVPTYAGSELIASLGGLEDPTTPWAAIAESGVEQLIELADDGGPYAERARAQGVTHVWGLAVRDPLHDSHAVIAFGRLEPDMEVFAHGYVLDIMARALQIILQWRYQVVSLRRSARSDPLTGLANRTQFREVLDRLHDEAERDLLSVLYLDLDGFKPINDEHGHHIGDVVLAEVGRRLTHVMRPGDVVARLGGDEFAIVAHHLAGEDAVGAIADRVVAAFAQPFRAGGHELDLSASVGIALAPADDFDPDRLLRRADQALYQAKAHGRGHWRLADHPAEDE